MRRRTHAKIVVDKVEPSNCRLLLQTRLGGYDPEGDEDKEIVAAVCTAANKFGLYDTVARICAEVAKEKTKALTLDVVQAAIKRVEALRS